VQKLLFFNSSFLILPLGGEPEYLAIIKRKKVTDHLPRVAAEK
jgi:hypothetical protein